MQEFSGKYSLRPREHEKFESEYRTKIFEWQGTVLRVDSFEEPEIVDESLSTYIKEEILGSGDYFCQILLRMDPRFYSGRSSISDQHPDLVLWFDEQFFKQNAEAIELLRRGDKIKFRGYLDKVHVNQYPLQAPKQENMYPHAQGQFIEHIERNGEKETFNKIKHSSGRYK